VREEADGIGVVSLGSAEDAYAKQSAWLVLEADGASPFVEVAFEEGCFVSGRGWRELLRNWNNPCRLAAAASL